MPVGTPSCPTDRCSAPRRLRWPTSVNARSSNWRMVTIVANILRRSSRVISMQRSLMRCSSEKGPCAPFDGLRTTTRVAPTGRACSPPFECLRTELSATNEGCPYGPDLSRSSGFPPSRERQQGGRPCPSLPLWIPAFAGTTRLAALAPAAAAGGPLRPPGWLSSLPCRCPGPTSRLSGSETWMVMRPMPWISMTPVSPSWSGPRPSWLVPQLRTSPLFIVMMLVANSTSSGTRCSMSSVT